MSYTLAAIARCGGTTIAQHPDHASYPEMPRHALTAANPDCVKHLDGVAACIVEAVSMKADGRPGIPRDIAREAMLLRGPRDAEKGVRMGKRVPIGCPDCGGAMQEYVLSGEARYRCHVDHEFTQRTLAAAQDETVENSLWMAIRTLRERQRVQIVLAETEERAGRPNMTAFHRQRAHESGEHAQRLQEMVLKGEARLG